jgi:predicted Zn-dependent protease
VEKLLSLAMIVKNEEKFLGDCLRSVEGVVDEMVIVDTGSTDNTVAIARQFGARILEIPWPDDFSLARNVGLDAVTTPWTLIMDADEEFVADDAEKLRQALLHPTADAYNIRIISLMDRAEDITESYVTRVVRNHPALRFTGAIHEQLFHSISQAHMALTQLDVRLTHKGYLQSIIQGKNKQERNRQLLEKHLASNPNDSYILWQLAQTYLPMGRAADAVKVSRQAVKLMGPETPLWVLCMMTYARALLADGQPKKALRVLEEGALAHPQYTDFWYGQGLIYMESQRYAQAEKLFHKCLELGEAHGFLSTDTGIGGFKSLFRIAQCYIRQGRSKEAVAYLLLTIKQQPHYRSGWRAIFEVLAGSAMTDVLATIALSVDLPQIVATLTAWPDLDLNEKNLLAAAKERLAANVL